jgi:hypothetical protein
VQCSLFGEFDETGVGNRQSAGLAGGQVHHMYPVVSGCHHVAGVQMILAFGIGKNCVYTCKKAESG